MSHGEYIFVSISHCSKKPPDDAHIDHGLLSVIRHQVQIALIILRSSGHVPETDVKDPAFLDFQDLIGHLSLKAEGARRQGQRLIKACSHLDGHGRIAFPGPEETCVWRNDIDWRFDKGRHSHNGRSGSRTVRVDPGVLDDVAYVLLRSDLNGDFSLPAGRNGPLKDGRGTGSIRAHSFDPEGIVSRIGDCKGVREDVPLLDFPEIDPGFFNHHSGPACG